MKKAILSIFLMLSLLSCSKQFTIPEPNMARFKTFDPRFLEIGLGVIKPTFQSDIIYEILPTGVTTNFDTAYYKNSQLIIKYK